MEIYLKMLHLSILLRFPQLFLVDVEFYSKVREKFENIWFNSLFQSSASEECLCKNFITNNSSQSFFNFSYKLLYILQLVV